MSLRRLCPWSIRKLFVRHSAGSHAAMTAARLLMSECVAKAVRARFREVAAQSVNQCHFGDTPKGELTEYESPQLGELIDAAMALRPSGSHSEALSLP